MAQGNAEALAAGSCLLTGLPASSLPPCRLFLTLEWSNVTHCCSAQNLPPFPILLPIKPRAYSGLPAISMRCDFACSSVPRVHFALAACLPCSC